MRRVIFVLILVASAIQVKAQDMKSIFPGPRAAAFLPAANRNPDRNKPFWILAGSEAALTAGDIWTTHRDLEHPGFYESWSSIELGRHPGLPRLSLTLAAETAAFDFAANRLDHYGHHRLARVVQLAHAGEIASAIVNNESLFYAHVR